MKTFRFRKVHCAHVAAYYAHRAIKPGSDANLYFFLHNAKCYLAAARGVMVSAL